MEALQGEEYADDGQAYELAALREQIALLSKQFFQDRQQWLEERRRLQETLKQHANAPTPGDSQRCSTVLRQQGQQRCSCASLLFSEAGSEAHGEDTSQGGLTVSSFTYSSCRSAESRSTSPTTGVSVSGPSELFTAVAELQRQLEGSRRQHESAAVRWTLEREALQRQVHALISMSAETSSGGSGTGLPHPHLLGHYPGDQAGSPHQLHQQAAQRQAQEEAESERLQLGERVQELEAVVEELQAERENLEQQLQVVAADASRAKRAVHAATEGNTAPPSPANAAGSPSSPFSSGLAGPRSPASAAEAEDPTSAFASAAAHAHAAQGALAAAPPPASPHTPPQAVAVSCAGTSGVSSEVDSVMGFRGAAPGASNWALTLTDSVRLPDLLSEKAELERELRRMRDECVAVPRAQYAELTSLRNQMVYMESELDQMRLEVEEAARQREVAELELAQTLQDCVAVPHAEYQRLLRQAAEARPREAAATVGGGAGVEGGGVRLEPHEHQSLLAAAEERDVLANTVASLECKLAEAEAAAAAAAAVAADAVEAAAEAEATAAAAAAASCTRRQLHEGEACHSARAGGLGEEDDELEVLRSEVMMLREQLAGAVGQAVSESSRLGSRVRELEGQLEWLQSENSRLMRESGAVRNALESGKVQASNSVRAAAAAAEEARTVAVGELAGMQMRVRSLEKELVAARCANEEAWAQRDELQLQMAAVRDAAVRTTDALADCQACREVAELAAAAAARDLAAATEELVALKMELAEAREMEVLFRRDVFKSKRMLHGLPLEWMTATGSGGGSGGSGTTGSAGSGNDSKHSRGNSGGSFVSSGGSVVHHASTAEVTREVEAEVEGPLVSGGAY